MSAKITVSCDEIPEKIYTIEKNTFDLPQKVFIAYKSKLQEEFKLVSIPDDPAGAYLYLSAYDHQQRQRPIRAISMPDSLVANGIVTTNPLMHIEFVIRNQAA